MTAPDPMVVLGPAGWWWCYRSTWRNGAGIRKRGHVASGQSWPTAGEAARALRAHIGQEAIAITVVAHAAT